MTRRLSLTPLPETKVPGNTVDAVNDDAGQVYSNAPDTITVAEILDNDTDPDGDSFTLQSIDSTSNLGATVTLVNGVVTYDPSTSTAIQNLADGQTLTDTVTYTIVDSRGAVDTATITYTVVGKSDGQMMIVLMRSTMIWAMCRSTRLQRIRSTQSS